jgi:Flp pilus assembly protein TadG
MLVAVPLLLVTLLAIVEFALVMSKLQQVALASRAGASVAAKQSSLDVVAVKTQVDRELAVGGISAGSCEVLLQHNVQEATPVVMTSGAGCTCQSPSTPALPSSSLVPAGCVRVTVCVQLSALTPDLLSTLGVSLGSSFVNNSTTLPYEAGS